MLEKTSNFTQISVFLEYFHFTSSFFPLLRLQAYCFLFNFLLLASLVRQQSSSLSGFVVNFGSTFCHQGFYLHLKSSLCPGIPLLWVMGQLQALDITWISGFTFSGGATTPHQLLPLALGNALLHYSLILPLPEQAERAFFHHFYSEFILTEGAFDKILTYLWVTLWFLVQQPPGLLA